MKKFSKINESVKVDIDRVNSILSELEIFNYKVYDYYYCLNKGRIELFTDVKDLKEKSHYANLILLSSDISKTNSEIEGWNEKLKFNSSGIYFFDDINDSKKYIPQYLT